MIRRCLTIGCLLVVTSLLLTRTYATRSEITLINNVYQGLLIGIGPDIPEDPDLITKIMEYFTLASSDLFTASRRRAYYGRITIVVPKTWTGNYSAATRETFNVANVIVDKVNPQHGDAPYTKQTEDCGSPGDYIHLTPRFVTDANFVTNTYGPIGKTLVHEWGHLRWGLFDEYAVDGDPNFYHSLTLLPDSTVSTEVKAVKCSPGVTGWHRNRFTGQDCVTNAATSLPEDDCRFFPNFWGNTAKASLMFFHFLTSVVEFCDDEVDKPGLLHDDQAPNRHNRLCSGLSAWSIMRAHPDFANGNNPPIIDGVTKPTFTVVQQQDQRYVLILDVSGSMGGLKITKMIEAAEEFIDNAIEDSYLGIVKFSSAASALVVSPKRVTSTSIRTTLKNLVKTLVANGGTCIGCGLNSGIQQLERLGDPKGGILVLMTDGKETKSPRIATVLPTIKSKGVIVNSILYTASADKQISSLAASTKGKSYFAGTSTTSTELSDAFATILTENGASMVQIVSDVVTVSPKGKHASKVSIDSTIKKVRFSFTMPANRISSIKLTSPSGVETKLTITGKGVTHLVVNPEGGQWRYTIQSSYSSKTMVQVGVTGDSNKYKVTAKVSTHVVDFAGNKRPKIAIYADVYHEYSPITSVKVVAMVTVDNNELTQDLFDKGGGADIIKHDGTYSGYFTKLSTNSKYSIKVSVVNNGSANTATKAASSRALNIQFNDTLDRKATQPTTYSTVEAFQRSTSGGFFSVQNLPASGDLYPPSTIRDLEVTGSDYDTGVVTLRWVAPGDDLDQGNATRYEIEMGTNYTHMTNSDYKSNRVNVTQEMLSAGYLTNPSVAGSVETFAIKLTVSETATYYFIVRAIDEVGQAGEVSNIVSSSFVYVAKADSGPNVALIVSLVLVSIVIIGVLIGVSAYCYHKKGKKKENTQDEEKVEKGQTNKAFTGNKYVDGGQIKKKGTHSISLTNESQKKNPGKKSDVNRIHNDPLYDNQNGRNDALSRGRNFPSALSAAQKAPFAPKVALPVSQGQRSNKLPPLKPTAKRNKRK